MNHLLDILLEHGIQAWAHKGTICAVAVIIKNGKFHREVETIAATRQAVLTWLGYWLLRGKIMFNL